MVVKNKKGHQVEETKKYITWHLEQHHKEHPGERIVLIFDFSNAGVTNMVSLLPTTCVIPAKTRRRPNVGLTPWTVWQHWVNVLCLLVFFHPDRAQHNYIFTNLFNST